MVRVPIYNSLPIAADAAPGLPLSAAVTKRARTSLPLMATISHARPLARHPGGGGCQQILWTAKFVVPAKAETQEQRLNSLRSRFRGSDWHHHSNYYIDNTQSFDNMLRSWFMTSESPNRVAADP